jgi:hypothetical protein
MSEYEKKVKRSKCCTWDAPKLAIQGDEEQRETGAKPEEWHWKEGTGHPLYLRVFATQRQRKPQNHSIRQCGDH